MSKVRRKALWIAAPILMAGVLLKACASTPACNNDACYDRQISSTDPYRTGDVAAWGSEKAVKEEDEAKITDKTRFLRPKLREGY